MSGHPQRYPAPCQWPSRLSAPPHPRQASATPRRPHCEQRPPQQSSPHSLLWRLCCPLAAMPPRPCLSARHICCRSRPEPCSSRHTPPPVARIAVPCRSCPPAYRLRPSSPHRSCICTLCPARPCSVPCRPHRPACRRAVRPLLRALCCRSRSSCAARRRAFANCISCPWFAFISAVQISSSPSTPTRSLCRQTATPRLPSRCSLRRSA